MDVKGVGKPSVFQNIESTFHDWVKIIEEAENDGGPVLETMQI